MQTGKRWELLHKDKIQKSKGRTEEILNILLENRSISLEEREDFLNPKLGKVTKAFVGLDQNEIEQTINRIKHAIEKEETIVVFGDYDVDGITGTAILWETLFAMGAKVMPYIPHRIDEGYGLSIKGIENVISQMPKTTLIITVDNGIVASEAVKFAKDSGIDVIITDHHVRGEIVPDAYAIVHTTKLCGAGVAWVLCQEFAKIFPFTKIPGNHLDLVALATVADLVPLVGGNRILVAHGLKILQQTIRPGLLEIYQEAKLDQQSIDTYAIGHVIAPRLNAMGRLASAMDSLRILCTKDRLRARVLADKLGRMNRERQLLTMNLSEHAKQMVSEQELKKIIVIAHETYEQGVIGLIAGRLVEAFYRPVIVLSKSNEKSKASARSISGFNIIETLRLHATYLMEHGGHPMAAGFSMKTELIQDFRLALEKYAQEVISDEMLMRVVRIDCELPIEHVTKNLFDAIQKLSPFGMGNFEPVFVAYDVLVRDIRAIGKEGTHLKMKVGNAIQYDAIAFGMGEMMDDISPGDTICIAYTIGENTWNGKTSLQLKVKDMKKSPIRAHIGD